MERALREAGGLLRRRDHPELTGSIDWMLRNRTLVPVLPGIYTNSAQALTPDLRVRAAARWEPSLIFTGATAARLSFWPELKPGAVTAALPTTRRTPRGFEVRRRHVPPELVIGRRGLRMTSPALTALDLCETHGGDGIDSVLRTRSATLALLHEAFELTGGRAGNRRRKTLLLESRAEPWSAAERRGHALLHDAGILGWRANIGVEIRGVVYYLDIGFPHQRLAVEIDGWEAHGGRQAFEQDRRRQNDLVLAGWRILRFTWDMLVRTPEVVVAEIRRALAG